MALVLIMSWNGKSDLPMMEPDLCRSPGTLESTSTRVTDGDVDGRLVAESEIKVDYVMEHY